MFFSNCVGCSLSMPVACTDPQLPLLKTTKELCLAMKLDFASSTAAFYKNGIKANYECRESLHWHCICECYSNSTSTIKPYGNLTAYSKSIIWPWKQRFRRVARIKMQWMKLCCLSVVRCN